MPSKDVTYNALLLQDPDLEFPSVMAGLASETGEQAKRSTSILVLDDDEHFRNLVDQVFTTHGYEVWHAKNADEAFSYLHLQQPDLAVIDYRLPGMDGVSWIAKVRRNGFVFPVVLCTGALIDQKTFNFMRNILHVSLVVQKPIVPELFLHSLEAILPPHLIPESKVAETAEEPAPQEAATAAIADQSVSLAPAARQNSAQDIADYRNGKSETSDQEADEKAKLKKRIATQQAITNARNEFALALPAIWNDLAERIVCARNSTDSQLWQQASAMAHKLKGSTGSYGFAKLSQVCDKLENFFNCLDPSCSTEQEILWSEINRWVDEGMECVSRAGTATSDNDITVQPKLSLLAVIPEESQSLHAMKQLASVNKWVFIEYSNSAIGARLKCNDNKFDAIFVDLSLDPLVGRFEIIKSLKSIPGYLNTPIVFICNQVYTPSQLTYAGASAAIDGPVSQIDLNNCLKQLAAISESKKQRILCIDDDQMLTRYMEAILTDEGFSARSLNEPIVALEEVDQYHPDLILLDILMPGISGFDVCRMLKAHETSAYTPIVFLTAKYDTTSRSCAFQAGAEDFLAKPVIKEELLARINAHLPQKKNDDSAFVSKEYFYRISNRLMCKLKNEGEHSTVVVLSILDRAQLNLLHGPFACEQVANMVTRILSLRFRPEDVRTQLEEDRFAVFIPGTSLQEADEIITALKVELAELWYANNHGEAFQPTISIQTAGTGYDGNSMEDLMDVCVEHIRQLNQ
jgi:DNA-binding response OmpR family regulator/HPt (histidine-containing phosphotransfer) domain-containing protein